MDPTTAAELSENDEIGEETNYDCVAKKVSLPFYSPMGSRIWYPECEEKPIVGTIYKTLDEAYLMYQQYAKKSGFQSKKSSSYNPNKVTNPKNKYFRCNREGKKYVKKPKPLNITKEVEKTPEDGEGEKKKIKRPRKTSSFRIGCEAHVGLSKLPNGTYRLNKFVEGHNHYLLEKDDMKFVRTTTKLGYMKEQFLFQVSTVNIGPVKGFKMLKEIYGGFEEIGVTKVDCKNFRRDVNVFVGKEDAQMAVEKLLGRMQFIKDFYVDYFLTEENKLAGVFWADPEAHRNYQLYGDVVSFDSTFKKNR